MSYRNPLMIQTNPGGDIAEAGVKAAKEMQNAILARIEKQEAKRKEAADLQMQDDALAIEQYKLSNTEQATAQAQLDAQAYGETGQVAFTKASNLIFDHDQGASNQNLTREERMQNVDAASRERQFQSNQVSALSALGEDKELYETLIKEKGRLFPNGAIGAAYVGIMEGNPDYKLEGSRNGNDWQQTVVNVKTKERFDLPTDKIKNGTFDGFVVTPDLYKNMADEAKANADLINKRTESKGEYQQEDLDKVTNDVANNIIGAQSTFLSYMRTDQVSAKALLKNTLMLDNARLKGTGFDEDSLWEALTSGSGVTWVGGKKKFAQKDSDYIAAMALVDAEIAEDIEDMYLTSNGVYRDDVNSPFKVYEPEPEAPTGNDTPSGGTAEWKKIQQQKDLQQQFKDVTKANVMSILNVKDGTFDIKDSSFNEKVKINGSKVTISQVDPKSLDGNNNPKETGITEYDFSKKSHVMLYLKRRNQYQPGLGSDISELAKKISDFYTQ